MIKLFSIKRDRIFFIINILGIKISLKSRILLEKELKYKDILIKNIKNDILLKIRELIKSNRIQKSLYDIVFIDTYLNISESICKYFKNSKYIKIPVHYDLENINDFIDILSAKIIVTSSESTLFKYLFENQILINIWHACGAFKKVGKYSVNNKLLFEHKNQYFITSSKYINNFYADSFNLNADNVKALGQLRTDILFNKEYIISTKNNIYKKFPILKDKKIYFYCPTFREGNNITSFSNFDIIKLSKLLNSNKILIYKLHPKIISKINKKKNKNLITNLCNIDNKILDMSDEDILELLIICDVILTDYSSAFIEGILLDKPVVFSFNDINKYERGFFIDYRKDLPGEIVKTGKAKDVLTALRRANIKHPNYKEFKKFHLDACDGHSRERICDFINNILNHEYK